MTKTNTADEIETMDLTRELPTEEIDGIDNLILPYVDILRKEGIETVQSCQGGEGHAYPVPTIEFDGEASEGWRALAIALQHQLPVYDLNRKWSIENFVPVGPIWEMTFTPFSD
ncbi:MAG: hypothetical protein OXI01_24195 [Albidovulum sp.]|nr:hypothetical protein [Albidovulum sp.]